MVSRRAAHMATLLSNGNVLISGGYNRSADQPLQCPTTVEIYRPATDSFRVAGSMIQSGCGNDSRVATPILVDGQILILSHRSRMELYNPATERFTLGGHWDQRNSVSVAFLPSGLILITGGFVDGDGLDQVELYDPASASIVSSSKMMIGRYGHSATLLSTGEVLITGGRHRVEDVTVESATAELFRP